MSQEWHYTRDGKQFGPLSLEEITELLQTGALAATDLVWHSTWPDWRPASEIPKAGFENPIPVQPIGVPGMLSYQGPGSPTGVVATAKALEMLRQTKPWVRFLSIVLFVLGGLFVVGGLILGIFLGSATRSRGPTAGVFFVYVAIGCLYFGPAVFLNRYAAHIGILLASQHPHDLENALEAQKSFWKFVGITATIVLCIYGFILFMALLMFLLR